MKKLLFVLITILIALVIVITVSLMGNTKTISEIKKENEIYEEYLNKEIFGTTVLSLLNRATNSNIQNEVAKDEKGFFINNDTDSIKIELVMLAEGKKVTYPMETIQKVGVEGFIKNFNLINFKCSKIDYHDSTKKISKIIFEQTEE